MAWNNEQQDKEITEPMIAMLEQLLNLAGEAEGVADGEVALTFVNDEQIHELNRDYRGIDRPTDVLSFAMNETVDEELDIIYELDGTDEEMEEMPDVLGDINHFRTTDHPASEDMDTHLNVNLVFCLSMVSLHLLGYDHQDEASEAEMMGKQEAVLAQAGLTR